MDSNRNLGSGGTPPPSDDVPAIVRQKGRPMWGCVKAILFVSLLLVLCLFVLAPLSLWVWTGTGSFDEYIRKRIELTLENRLGREVTIGRVESDFGRESRVILHDIRIANVPGATRRYFATAKEVEIVGGLESFWGRSVRVGRIDIREPFMSFEVLPEAARFAHNFPKWKTGPKRRYEIYRLDVSKLNVINGTFEFLDQPHEVSAVVTRISSEVTPTIRRSIYEGVMQSPSAVLRLQDYEPIPLNIRGGFLFTPGVLELKSVALRGRGIEAFLSGRLSPVTEAVYRFDVSSRLELARVAEIFRVNQRLTGPVALTGTLNGRKGDFTLDAAFNTGDVVADTYELAGLRGRFRVTDEATRVLIDRGAYGGGTISGEYNLARYADPYPMSIDLRYNSISVEKLYEDWDVQNTGLRGAATGRFTYNWNKDQILEGSGEGNARLAPGAVAFGNAPYPMPLSGATRFALNDGVIAFAPSQLKTPKSTIDFSGRLKIEGLDSDLRVAIRSGDFAELDRIGFNFARSAGQDGYELLGLGGAGTVSGTVRGPFKEPMVAARIDGRQTAFRNVVLGDAAIDLTYDGPRSTLAFRQARFALNGATMTLAGTIAFPENAPSPRFDLDMVAAGYPVERALAAVNLDFEIDGTATGRLAVRGNPESGTVAFNDVVISDEGARLAVSGPLSWQPGKGNVTFGLVLQAENYPVEKALRALNLDLKVAGNGTGRLRVDGSAERGTVTFENLVILEGNSRLALNGPLSWAPGEGNLTFDLDIAATNVPASRIAEFFDFESLPVSGSVTGTLHLEGPKESLDGAGSITLRNGSLFGEPVDVAVADLTFDAGVVRATNVEVRSPAGVITGEGEYNLATEKFGYLVRSADIDLDQVRSLAGLRGLFGGRLRISSTGAGTIGSPELVFEATLENPRLGNVALPDDAPPPRLYIAIRNGELIVQGSAFDLVTIEGRGTVAESGALAGNVRINVLDVGRLASIAAPGMEIEASGTAVADLTLGGNVNSLETLRIDGSIPELALRVSGHEIAAAEPITFTYQNGTIALTSFRIRTDESLFVAAGTIGVTGERRLDLEARGLLEAAIVQLFVPDMRAAGHVDVALRAAGTLDDPRVTGTAEVRDAELRLAGFPQLISDITGTIVFRGSQIEIDSMRASLGGGTVVAGGSIDVAGMAIRRMRLSFRGDNVLLRYFEGITVDGDFNLLLSGDPERMLLQGDVAVEHAVYSRDFDFATSILNLLLERGAVLPEVAASWQERVALRISISAPGTLAVRNNIADVTGSATIDLTGTLANPAVLGEVVIDEGGRVRFQDVNYRVVRGTILFTNPFRIDPYFDVTAEGRLQEYDLTINLTGTLDRINPVITSDPPAGDITLLSLLTQNVGPDAQSVVPAFNSLSSLGTAGTSLLAQSLGGLLGSRILPFADSFRIEPGDLETFRPTVTFEKQISRDLRAIVQFSQEDQRRIETIEWQATPDWIIQFTHRSEERGENNDYSATALDARFRRRYSGRWGGERRELQERRAEAGSEGTTRTIDLAALPVAALAEEAPVITSVSFKPDTNFDTTRLHDLVSTRLGTPLSIRATQDSIKALYATGDFRDIQVDAAQSGAAVALTYRLSINYRVRDIAFEDIGEHRARADREVQFRVGDVFSLNAVDRSAVGIQNVLRRRGYLEATVDPEVRFDRAQNEVDVTFFVTKGPRARIAAVNLEGDLGPFNTAQLLDAMRVAPGGDYSLERAREGADRLRRFLIRRKHRAANIRYIGETYDADANSVTLAYRVEVGPTVEVQVTGVPRRAVRRLIPFGRSEAYSEDRIARAQDEIVEAYQRRGHFFAVADTREEREGNVLRVIFDVRPGQRYKLDDVLFEGNNTIGEDELREVVSVAPVGGFRRLLATLTRRPIGVTQEQLNADRDALETFYRLEGFAQARIGQARVMPAGDGTIDVVFPIDEGPRTLVTQLEIEGAEEFAPGALPELQLAVGEPLNPLELNSDLIALRTHYADAGYPEVQVTPSVDVSEDRTAATVRYRISEGPKVTFDEVVVTGNDYTDRSVILRKAGIREGEPFSFREILAAQRELQRLAIFQRIEVTPQRAGTATSERDVTIEVEEGKALSVSGAIGYSTDEGARGAASIAHRNLFGTARYLGLDARYSELKNRYVLTYREPFTFGFNVPTQVSIFRNEEQRSTALITGLGTFIEASRVVREQTRWSLRYDYRRVTVECENGECPDLRREDTPIQISSVTPTFFWDRRDDPLNPHSGFFASSSLEYAFPLFSAKTSFLKTFTQGAWYRPFGRSTLAVSGRIGLIEQLSRAPDGVDADEAALYDVPFSEKFFAGGETSHRAYELETLGVFCEADPYSPCDDATLRLDRDGNDIIPLGGNGLGIINVEYRFPLFGSLFGGVFADIGNVWRDIDAIDLGEVRYGVGAGLRYVTPVGPVRLDFGYKLNRAEVNGQPVEDPFAIFLTIGYPF